MNVSLCLSLSCHRRRQAHEVVSESCPKRNFSYIFVYFARLQEKNKNSCEAMQCNKSLSVSRVIVSWRGRESTWETWKWKVVSFKMRACRLFPDLLFGGWIEKMFHIPGYRQHGVFEWLIKNMFFFLVWTQTRRARQQRQHSTLCSTIQDIYIKQNTAYVMTKWFKRLSLVWSLNNN